jgi:hypothetical protein
MTTKHVDEYVPSSRTDVVAFERIGDTTPANRERN